jgi:lipopolysaccharide biosynthesis glycosyltransferase
MKWIFALNEKNPDFLSGENYEIMAHVAVHSAKLYAPKLEPYLIWNGPITTFTESMKNNGVTVIHHSLSFEEHIINALRPTDWKHIAKGAMLRLDIPEIFATCSESILYTDVDVIFQDDPSNYLFDTKLFAFSPEFDIDDFVNINTGVMILNLQSARDHFPLFINWTINNLGWIPDYDQGAIRGYFNMTWDRLDPRMNWKPYWNICPNPIIVHFHGPKPTDFDPISLVPRFMEHPDSAYAKLYQRGFEGYENYLRKWIACRNDAFR